MNSPFSHLLSYARHLSLSLYIMVAASALVCLSILMFERAVSTKLKFCGGGVLKYSLDLLYSTLTEGGLVLMPRPMMTGHVCEMSDECGLNDE
jgi:hypothetical protein